MIGQWIGTYDGTVSGNLMVNIDAVGDHYEAVAYINPATRNIPASVAYLGTKNKRKKQVANAFVNAVDPRNGYQCPWEEIKHLYGPDVNHSKEAEVTIKKVNEKLHLEAVSDIGVVLRSVLSKPLANQGSRINGVPMSWHEFKSYISEISRSRYIFRGQKEPWRLRTSFHRRGRYRINQFTSKDVKQLHQRLSAITAHYFDLSIPQQNGAFFNLLQHHGYPTPLLDWSHSPYVAAFFAFRDWPIKYRGGGNARIYIFDNEAWQKRYPQLENLDPPYPHLSVMEFIAINNPRLVPQQAVTTVTNIDDIEAYVLGRQAETGIEFLKAVDIPAKDREEAIRDLRFMGITAGSMFPGIDGVCEELRECNFDA